MKVQTTIYLSEENLKLLKKLAFKQDCSRSQIIEQLLEAHKRY